MFVCFFRNLPILQIFKGTYERITLVQEATLVPSAAKLLLHHLV
jgi:hypothetical protein